MAAKRNPKVEKIQCSFVFSAEERDMLAEVAAHEDRSAASWLRQAIRAAHVKLTDRKKGGRR